MKTNLPYNTIYLRLLIILLFLIAFFDANCQQSIENNAFTIGEDVDYDVYYNWGFIWMHAAQVRFMVKEAKWQNKPALNLISEGSTLSGYDWFYMVRDHYESIVNPQTLNPYWFKCDTHEGSHWAKEIYHFDNEKSLVVTQTANVNRPFGIDTLKVKPNTTDLLTAIYICRNLDFQNLVPNTKIPIFTVVGNKKYDLYIRYIGFETIENRTDEQYNCYKFAVKLVDGSIFSGGEDMTVWVSNDQNRIPILIEARIKVGAIKAYVKTVKGNRWPMTKPQVAKSN